MPACTCSAGICNCNPRFRATGAVRSDSQSTPSATVQQQPSPAASQTPSVTSPKEGFWGRVNPFARKKWVNNRVDPLKGQLNELDEVNAKNARDIQDVDSRAQAGIRQAQSTADAANQTATAAGSQAQNASATAQGASTPRGPVELDRLRPGSVSSGERD